MRGFLYLIIYFQCFSSGICHYSLFYRILTQEFNNYIRISIYVIVDYDDENVPVIVTNKIGKEIEVSTMEIRSPKIWKWLEWCDKTFYELDNT